MPYYYIAQTDVQNYIGQTLTTNGLNSFNMMLQPMQDMIDWYCNRSWNFTNPVTENFDAIRNEGGQLIPNLKFFIKYPKISANIYDTNYPLAAGIHSITVGGSPIDKNYVFSYDTHAEITTSFANVLFTNPLGLKAVTVIYDSDAAQNVPTPVKLAFAEWMARRIQNAPDANKDAVQAFAGQVKVTYKQDSSGAMPDFVKMVLNRYRLPTIEHW